jgi:competence protein ComEA
MELPTDLFAESPLSIFWQNYKIPVLVGSGSLLCIVISIILIVKSIQTHDPIKFSTDSAAVLGSSDSITIDIEGGVVNPGVYQIPAKSRINDAIVAAGGLSADSDVSLMAKSVNRAGVVEDGQKIYIPKINTDITSHNNGFATYAGNNTSQNLGGVVATPQTSSQNAAGDDISLISLNSASESELDSLPGVGPVTAQKIINNRPYSDIQELVVKKAVGASVFGKIKDLISL